jgi:tetratricopeptide (TPR) repeat protein
MADSAQASGTRSVAVTGTVTGGTINTGDRVYQLSPPRPVDPADLAAAQALLATLPLDSLPDPAPLPMGSRMLFRRNPLFVGREQDLEALAATLKGGGIAAATGLGGIGKTQLATEVVHRYGAYFAGGVFWLSFAAAGGVPAEVAACGAMGLIDRPDYGGLKLDEQVPLVLAAWQSALPRLLIFDNCEDEALLAVWRPPSGGCRVLITSRRATWDSTLGVTARPLGVLSRAESIALLRKHRPDLLEGDADLAAIAAELGDLPLALHLAGSFLETYHDDPRFGAPADFRAELRSARLMGHPALEGEDMTPSPTNHVLHIGRTFALSYERLDAADPIDALALALLARAAHFAPGEPIPRDLLLATLELDMEARPAARQAAKALRRLTALGLREDASEGAMRLHRLLAAFVGSVVIDEAAQPAVEQALIDRAADLNAKGVPAPLLVLQAHLRYVTDTAMRREDERAAMLCSNFGYYLDMIGDLAGARPYYERALAIREQVLGEKHPDTAESLYNLGLLLQAQGDLAGARLYLEQALAMRRAVLGPLHPYTLQSMGSMGYLLRAQGDLAGVRGYYEQMLAISREVLREHRSDAMVSINYLGTLLFLIGDLAAARPYYEQALAISREVLGERHLATAKVMIGLGKLLQAQGDLAAARPYLEQALAISREVLGERHPTTAKIMGNLSTLLQAQGDLAAARPYFEQALAIYREVLGEKHPVIAMFMRSLGLMLQEMGDLAAARPYFEQALAIREQVLGEKHPDIAESLYDLGKLLQAQGDLAGARPYLEQALAMRRAVLGERHSDTAQSLNDLGRLLWAQGDLAAARPYFEQVLAISREVLGERHSDTALSLNYLGALLVSMGDLTGARPYYEQALAISQEVLGERHFTTAMIMGGLGNLLQAQGDLAAARPYYEQVLAISREVLGEKHPDTARILNDLGNLLWAQGNLVGARPYLEQALAMRRAVLGEKHPDIAESLNDLGTLLWAQGDLAAARPYLEQALAIYVAQLGADHPTTRTIRGNLAALDVPLQTQE